MSQRVSWTRRIWPWIWQPVFILLATVVLLVAIFAGCYAYARLTATTTGDIRALISENVPLGSSAAEVQSFLESEEIDYGSVERLGDYGFGDREFSYAPDTPVIVALVRNTAEYYLTEVDIQIVFFLSSELRLIDYEVFEIYTSL